MRKLTWIICLTAAVFLSGCGDRQTPAASFPPHILELEPPAETIPAAPFETCSYSDGLDRFIECYNRCCLAYGTADPFRVDGWDLYGGVWHYRQFEDIWTEPDYQILVGDSGAVREIRIGFEDHGYTEWGEAISDERAFFTLRCLCGDASDEEITRLIAAVKSDMRETGAAGAKTPQTCGRYEISQFFSGGVYWFCILEGGPGN